MFVIIPQGKVKDNLYNLRISAKIVPKGADVMRITENENGFSPSERQYLLYRYLLENTNSESVATPAEIKKYLENYGIKISTNTLYNDLRILGTAETFNLQWEYDQKKKGYRVTNPTFEPREIRLLIDSIQASHFITQAKADALVKKIKTLTDKYTLSTLNRPTVVSGRVRSMNDSVVTEADRLYQAIAEDSQIQFYISSTRQTSRSLSSFPTRERKFKSHPLHSTGIMAFCTFTHTTVKPESFSFTVWTEWRALGNRWGLSAKGKKNTKRAA